MKKSIEYTIIENCSIIMKIQKATYCKVKIIIKLVLSKIKKNISAFPDKI